MWQAIRRVAGQGAAALLHHVHQGRQRAYRDALHQLDAAKYSRMAQELLALCGAHQEPGPTLGVETRQQPADAVQAAITDVTGTAGLPPDRLTMDEKIRIVDDLQQAGIFYMKGAVSEVAAQLGSSEATIYRYLSKLKD